MSATQVTVVWIVVLIPLVAVSAVASYLRLLMRRLSPMGTQRVFQTPEARRIRADRERVGVSISALHGAAMALFAIGLTGLILLDYPGELWEKLVTAVLLVLGTILVFDQSIPFVMVARHDEPEQILQGWLPVLRFSVYLALPLTFPILVSSSIARLLESPEDQAAAATAQNGLEELIEKGREAGLIRKSEEELLQSVVDFGETFVWEVMTPRHEIAALDIDSPIEALRETFRERRYTRYPVYKGDLDHIEGIVSVRDLMELPPEQQSKTTLRSLVRPVLFVPETKPAAGLLKELQKTTSQLAIVVDEYGSVSGLATVEDLVEELVGEIRDEVEPHDRDIQKESAGTYMLEGQAELAKVAEQIHVEFEEGDYSTVAGLVLARLGHMPEPGDRLKMHGLQLEVVDVNERAILKVRLKLEPKPSQADSAHARN
jgi:magnesium and cobalt exporter, CNNM family